MFDQATAADQQVAGQAEAGREVKQREHVTVAEAVKFLTSNFDLADYTRGGLNLTAERTT